MYDPHPIEAGHVGGLLCLNNMHAAELSLLDESRFVELMGVAFLARATGEDAFLFAFDQDAAYDSPNFLWFRERFDRFVYVDRVAVSPSVRGRGHARRLYDALFTAARAAGHERVVCEVNVRPPNPVSQLFHERLGFVEIGQADIHGGYKTVRYLERGL